MTFLSISLIILIIILNLEAPIRVSLRRFFVRVFPLSVLYKHQVVHFTILGGRIVLCMNYFTQHLKRFMLLEMGMGIIVPEVCYRL